MSATSPTSRRGRAGRTWRPRHRPGLSSCGRVGLGRSHAHRAGPPTPSPWPSPTVRHSAVSSSIPTAAVNIRVATSPSWPEPTVLSSRSGARASAGTTRWPNRSSPPSSASSSAHVFLADENGAPTCRLRVHRGLVQHASAALRHSTTPARLNTKPCPPQRRPSGGIINTSNVSVRPDQAQLAPLRARHGWHAAASFVSEEL